MSGPFDPRAPACAWLEDGHAEDWSRGGCLDAPSGGACAYREPEDDDPYLLLLFMLIVTACDIPMRLGLKYLFDRIILPPVLGAGGAALGAADAGTRNDTVQATSRDPPRTEVDPARLCEMPVPSAALDALEAAAAPPGGVIDPAASVRVIELVERGASASLVATDGSTLLHLFCRRFANATPDQLAILVAAHPAQRAAIDSRGRTPLHCLVSFAAELTPVMLGPLIDEGGAVPDADGRTPLHAACADRRAVRRDVLALLVDAHPAAREQRDAAGATPLDYALARDVALGSASIALLAPRGECDVDGIARPSPPRITATEVRGAEVWLSLRQPAGGYPNTGDSRVLRYEIEIIACAGASLPDNVPTRTVSVHRPAPRVAVVGLADGATYAFRVRAVGIAGAGAWSRANATRNPSVTLSAPRPVPSAARRRNANAVVVAGSATTDEREVAPPVGRPVEAAPHAALGDVRGSGGLVINRALRRILRAQHFDFDDEYEVLGAFPLVLRLRRASFPMMKGFHMCK
jgi:hypothetical protein